MAIEAHILLDISLARFLSKIYIGYLSYRLKIRSGQPIMASKEYMHGQFHRQYSGRQRLACCTVQYHVRRDSVSLENRNLIQLNNMSQAYYEYDLLQTENYRNGYLSFVVENPSRYICLCRKKSKPGELYVSYDPILSLRYQSAS